MKLVYPRGAPPAGVDVLYRCEARRYSVCLDPEAERYGVTDPQLEMRWYEVKKRTPKGAWIEDRFVLLTAHKKWACNTEEDALASFKARRERQIRILHTQLRRAEQELALLEPDPLGLWSGSADRAGVHPTVRQT